MDNTIGIIPGLEAMPIGIPGEDHRRHGETRGPVAYLCLGDGADLSPKPVVVMLQGSSPSSVFARRDDGAVELPFGLVPLLQHRPTGTWLWWRSEALISGAGSEAGAMARGERLAAQNLPDVRAGDIARIVDVVAGSEYFDGSDILVAGHSGGSDEAPLAALASELGDVCGNACTGRWSGPVAVLERPADAAPGGPYHTGRIPRWICASRRPLP